VMDHPHTEANSVIGGPVYRGSKLPKLAGAFVYGDYITGTIWAIQPDKDRSYSHVTLLDTDLRIVAFCEASHGELYVLDHDFTGQIYELLPNDAPDLSANFPRRLSQTGLFANLKTLTPTTGVVPYEVVAKRWMDGAQAERWVAVPGEGQIRLAERNDDEAAYPQGTVFVKHLSLPQGESSPPIRLETQLLHFEQGVWRPYSYLWNEQGDEATLVDSIGTSRPLRVRSALSAEPTERTWHVNAVNECKLCHNAGPKFVLGFNAPQLGGAILADRSSPETMLERLQQQGVLASVPPLAADDPGRLVDPHDPRQPVEARARSYLHANCAMCHHPGGNAIVSFFLRRDLPLDKLNTNKGTGIGTFGLNDARIISPGDPFRSILLYRMSKLGYARMPYIGSRVVDSRGVALVEQWIRSMPATFSAEQAAELKANSEGPGLLKTSERANAETLQRLTASTGSSLALAVAIHRGDLPEPIARKAVVAGVAAKSDIRGLFETFVPEAQRKATLGATFDPQLVLARTGDAERGKLIYYSDGARCRNCHEHDDRERSLGPTLAEIRKKYPRNEELLQHVLNPSLKIDEPFAAYTVHTTDGQVISGLIIEQNERNVAIKTTERKVVRLARDEIEDLQRSDKSLMPERILGDLTAQEAADLFEYLRSGAGK